MSHATCAIQDTVFSNTLQFNLATAISPVASNDYGVKLFPNPVQHYLTLDSLKPSDKWETLEIVSSDGKIIRTTSLRANSKTVTVDVSRLADGFYFILLRNRKGAGLSLSFIKH